MEERGSEVPACGRQVDPAQQQPRSPPPMSARRLRSVAEHLGGARPLRASAAAMTPSAASAVKEGATTVVYNEDGDLQVCLTPGQGPEQLRQNIDWTFEQLGRIDIWEYHCATPDVCFFDSQSGEVLGRRLLEGSRENVAAKPYNPKVDTVVDRDHLGVAIDDLIASGNCPLDVRIASAHKHGAKLVGEIRMADTHQRELDLSDPLVALFVVENQELLIPREDGFTPVALDYSHETVRAHRLAIMRDVIVDHGADGLSLNFIRWGHYFPRDFGRSHAPIMTAFLAEIRAMLDAAGHAERPLLGARIASTPEENLAAGLDVLSWIRRGYLDYVIVSEWNSPWPGVAVEPFVAAAEGTRCQVYGNLNDMVGGGWTGLPSVDGPSREGAVSAKRSGYGSMLLTSAEARAIAANIYSWGGSGIGLWNVSNNFNAFGHGEWGQMPEQMDRMRDWVVEATDRERVAAGRRVYHYLPLYKGRQRNYKHVEAWRSPLGSFKGPTLYFNEGEKGERLAFPFRMADGRDGEGLEGTLRFRLLECTAEDRWRFDLNGVELNQADVDFEFGDGGDSTTALPQAWATVPLPLCPPFRGDNELGLRWLGDGSDDAAAIRKEVPYMEELIVTVEP